MQMSSSNPFYAVESHHNKVKKFISCLDWVRQSLCAAVNCVDDNCVLVISLKTPDESLFLTV